jgi:hypothetical protein
MADAIRSHRPWSVVFDQAPAITGATLISNACPGSLRAARAMVNAATTAP